MVNQSITYAIVIPVDCSDNEEITQKNWFVVDIIFNTEDEKYNLKYYASLNQQNNKKNIWVIKNKIS